MEPGDESIWDDVCSGKFVAISSDKECNDDDIENSTLRISYNEADASEDAVLFNEGNEK